jgi:hypothetical protein
MSERRGPLSGIRVVEIDTPRKLAHRGGGRTSKPAARTQPGGAKSFVVSMSKAGIASGDDDGLYGA